MTAASAISPAAEPSDNTTTTRNVPPSPSAAARRARRIAEGYIPSPLKKPSKLNIMHNDDSNDDTADCLTENEFTADKRQQQRQQEVRSIPQLEESAEKLKMHVFETINSHYREFINTHQYALDLRDEIEALAEQIEQLRQKLNAEKPSPLTTQSINALRKTATILKQLTKLHHHIQNFDGLVEIGELKAATKAVLEMSSILEELSELSVAGTDSDIIALVKEEYVIKKASLRQRLEELYACAFKFSQHDNESELLVNYRISATPSKTFYENPIHLDELLYSIRITPNLLAEKFSQFTQQVLDSFVLLIIERGSALQVTVNANKLHASLKMTGPGANAANSGGTPAATTNANTEMPNLLSKILQVAQFLHTNIFASTISSSTGPTSDPSDAVSALHQQDISYTSLLSNYFWPRFWQILFKKYLYACIPDDRKGLTDTKMRNAQEYLLEFERNMKCLELMPQESFEISEFVHYIQTFFAKKLRNEFLNAAKSILQSDDLNTEEVMDATERGGFSALSGGGKSSSGNPDKAGGGMGKSGKEGLESYDTFYKLPTMHVSRQAQMIVEQAYQALEDAIKLGNTTSHSSPSSSTSPTIASASSKTSNNVDVESAIELFYCARDLFDLFRAIVPIHQAELIENVPARTMIFFNDCTYICYHLLTLAYQYRTHLEVPEVLKETCTFVDMIPEFRKLGETYLKAQMRTQRDQLRDLIKRSEGFHGLTQDTRFDTVERALKQVSYTLSNLAKSWKPISPRELYFKSMGVLIRSLVDTILEQITALTSLDADESHQLRHVLGLVQTKIEECFEIRKTDSSSNMMNGQGKVKKCTVVERAPIPKYVSNWEKYLVMMKVLEMDEHEVENWVGKSVAVEYKDDVKQVVLIRFGKQLA